MVDPVRELRVSALPREIAGALRDAFGGAPIENIAVMTGGRSGATLLSLVVEGAGYVLRRPDPERPWHVSRFALEIACMTTASRRGVAPRIRHVDAAAGVVIMDRVDAAPPDRSPERRARRIERIAKTLRRLHTGPPFPKGAGALGMVRHVDGVLRARRGDGLPERLLRTLDPIERVTAPYAESAPCHRDLNPANILETQDAIHIVDWELAGASDPFFDLAQLGVFSFPAPADRAALLEAYLERSPSEEDAARATVTRVMALGFYAAAFVHAAASEPAAREGSEVAPMPFAEVLRLLATARERAPAGVVAASLLEETRREAERDAYQAAMRALLARR